jgi:hypothetical protein
MRTFVADGRASAIAACYELGQPLETEGEVTGR